MLQAMLFTDRRKHLVSLVSESDIPGKAAGRVSTPDAGSKRFCILCISALALCTSVPVLAEHRGTDGALFVTSGVS